MTRRTRGSAALDLAFVHTERTTGGTLRGPAAAIPEMESQVSPLDPSNTTLAPLLQAFSPMALTVREPSTPVVGRQAEQEAIRQELSSAKAGRLGAVTFEGEPGIGKTRLLLAAASTASAEGFTTIAVTADEELRGPFLLARSIVGSAASSPIAAERPEVAEALTACLDAMSGRDDPGLASLPPDRRLLRTFDLGAVAFRAVAAERPLVVLIDDVQWSDDDSLRLLRYVVRSIADSPILLVFAIRPEELALVTEAVNLIADMERMGLIRRLKVDRLTQPATREVLTSVLGGPVDSSSAAVMHAQAEGVPFIVEEMARAYRDGGMIQQIDGVWRLARNTERLVPSAVKTLISRRSAHLPEQTKAMLADAAVLGRHFSLEDLREVEVRVNDLDRATEPNDLAGTLLPAVAAGLLTEHGEDSAADFSFRHEQVRDFAAATLSATRRRALHAAIVQMLLDGEPSPASLPLLAHHAKAAGDAAVCVRFSVEASRNALAANAPEEVLRVVEVALPSAASPKERLDLLDARDRAFDMLRRPADRLEGLAELAALAEALRDSHLQLDVRLRRAAALRTDEEFDRAAELAREVRTLAKQRSDPVAELAACLELGQDLLRATAGESFAPAAREVDLDGAEEAFFGAIDLARESGDDATLATALREAAVVQIGRVRAWFVEQVSVGAHLPIAQRVAAGEVLEDLLPELPIASNVHEAARLLKEALEIFERLGDRRGAMASIIAMGYLSWAPDIHMGPGSARHIEEIRRLTSKAKTFTNESERALLEAQMLFGVHVFARAKLIPDLALSRGEQAYAHAREMGERSLEFAAAGGTAMSYVDLGEVEPARRWIERAAAVASEHPTPLRARRLEAWRGIAAAAAGDATGMRTHLERAVELATVSGKVAARCEALARLALEASRLGAELSDEDLLELGERAATDASALSRSLPGHPPWGAEADAALASVALARGRIEDAASHARSALAAMQSAMSEDQNLAVAIPVARALAASGAPEWKTVREQLQLTLAMTAQRTMDEDVRVRWFQGPTGRELTRIIGPIDEVPAADGRSEEGEDSVLLRSLIHGSTNREIAQELGTGEAEVIRRLGELYIRIGASSRAEATAFAFRERVL